ncbi:MAG TPA: serine hydrolase [Saprospiraceae bacterium]|nr:serine hydrolase [Saprospiraceae bacterium]
MNIKFLYFLVIISTFFACSSQKAIFYNYAEGADKVIIKRVLDQDTLYQASYVFTPLFGDQKTQVYLPDESRYFYPASTVKFPIALMAIEKMNEEKLGLDNFFFVEGDSIITSLRKEITKIFAVSDNNAYNRLFEWLGQEDIDRRLKRWGMNQTRIIHRLSTPNSGDSITRKVMFRTDGLNQRVYESKLNVIPKPLSGINKTALGRGYMMADSLVASPMDFSNKNFMALTDLHQLMTDLMSSTPSKLKITASDIAFLKDVMSAPPKSKGYDEAIYPDNYVKFLIKGDSVYKDNNSIIIYNKVGQAYGFLTDCSYVLDKKSGKAFIMTATILVNSDGIFNDDHYEYDEVGFPFLGALGRAALARVRGM